MVGTKIEAAIRHALGEMNENGQCVLEFVEDDDGRMQIRDITNHVNKLEELANE
jgi:hypothetical protein